MPQPNQVDRSIFRRMLRRVCTVCYAPAAKGAETATPGAASKEPQRAQGKPDSKATGEMKADSKSTASDSTAPTTTSKDIKNPTAETKSAPDSKSTGEIKADSKTKATDSSTNSKDLKNADRRNQAGFGQQDEWRDEG
jgi:hypothetical protein